MNSFIFEIEERRKMNVDLHLAFYKGRTVVEKSNLYLISTLNVENLWSFQVPKDGEGSMESLKFLK